MNDKALLFSVAAVLLGAIMFSFAVTYHNVSKAYSTQSTLITIERASSQFANAEYNMYKAFKRSSGLNISQSGARLSIEGQLPYNTSYYFSEMYNMDYFIEQNLPNTSVTFHYEPFFRSIGGMNLTYVDERTLRLHILGDVVNVTLDAEIPVAVNMSQCNFSKKSAEDDRMSVKITGYSNSCQVTDWIMNASHEAYAGVNEDKVSLSIINNTIELKNNYNIPLKYLLSVKINGTLYVMPGRMGDRVETTVDSSRKSGWVRWY
ncbi:hypothetical protein ACFLRF_01375 [Candidatus Altiarchaeota archaeon]